MIRWIALAETPSGKFERYHVSANTKEEARAKVNILGCFKSVSVYNEEVAMRCDHQLFR